MSPSMPHPQLAATYEKPNLYIHGIGVEYPPYQIKPEHLATLARRFYPPSPAYVASHFCNVSQMSDWLTLGARLDKVLMINEFTGIETRSVIGNIDLPLANRPDPPMITDLCDFFLDHGVKLSVAACRKAIDQWGGDLSDITHVVATTCTNSANPGFDHYVVKELGLNVSIEKVLLHGVGCSGGLAALRTAANISLGASFLRRPARILVMSCEISSLLVRSELESIVKNQEVRIGVTLFSDCASAVVLGNGFGQDCNGTALLELLGWDHRIIENTEKDLGFDIDPLGNWRVDLWRPLADVDHRLESRAYSKSPKAGICRCSCNVPRPREVNPGVAGCGQDGCGRVRLGSSSWRVHCYFWCARSYGSDRGPSSSKLRDIREPRK